jgi:hypothetical protein
VTLGTKGGIDDIITSFYFNGSGQVKSSQVIRVFYINQCMDPHSRLSQFNQRPPKAGPVAINQRHMDSLSPSLHRFTKSSPSTPQSKSLDNLSRPIATNSRVKQGERFRKDMYLAFVNNALQQKFIVRAPLCPLISSERVLSA